MYNKIKVAIVDDHPIVLEGLQKLLQHSEEYQVVGGFTSGASFIEFIKANDVDIVLLDITLPDISGIDLCIDIKKMNKDIAVLGLSNHSERSLILQMLQNGAIGYLLKNISAEELYSCLQDAMNGKLTFSPAVREIMARPTLNELKGIPQVTKREKEILQLIADGKTTANIADELFLSPLTVETHRKRLMQKFEVKNVASLIKAAVANKII